MARVYVVGSIKIALRRHACHVVHRGGDGRLDARVDGGGIQRKAAPAADAEDADARRVDIFLHGQKIDRRLIVLSIDVGRSYIARFTSTLTGERGVERDGQKAALGQCLRVKSGGLLLHRAERPADGDSGELAARIFRLIEVCRQRDTEAVMERHLAVPDFIALGKTLSHSCVTFKTASFILYFLSFL